MSSSKKHIPVQDHNTKSHKQQDAEGAEQESQAPAAEADDAIGEKVVDLAELAEKLTSLEKEKADLLDRLQRHMAEFDNYRKRVNREKDDLLKYGTEKMALDMLQVADNFERALEQAKTAADVASVVAGIEMIYKQFLATLEKYKIKPFDSLGEQFDPEKHEAMAHQEHPEYDENTVMAELQKGYFLDDRLLRPARVVVSRGQGDAGTAEQEG